MIKPGGSIISPVKKCFLYLQIFQLAYLPIIKIISIFVASLTLKGGGNTYKFGIRHMDKNLKKFMDTPTKSRAQILNEHEVEVHTPDGEIFKIWSHLARFENEEYRNYVLHLIEFIFDRNFSDDKEKMINRISRELILNAIPSVAIGPGNRQDDRVRIGKRIRELREAKKMEARDLAILTGIDAANLSRIEQGKYSTGIDILSRIAIVLNAHLDLIPNEQ